MSMHCCCCSQHHSRARTHTHALMPLLPSPVLVCNVRQSHATSPCSACFARSRRHSSGISLRRQPMHQQQQQQQQRPAAKSAAFLPSASDSAMSSLKGLGDCGEEICKQSHLPEVPVFDVTLNGHIKHVGMQWLAAPAAKGHNGACLNGVRNLSHVGIQVAVISVVSKCRAICFSSASHHYTCLSHSLVSNFP